MEPCTIFGYKGPMEALLSEQEDLAPRRGIAPDLLVEQVRNTVPFALAPGFHPELPYLARLRDPRATSPSLYFGLCLSAHYATVASFVPTDVDHAIRFKLWDPSLAASGELSRMAEIVLEAEHWDTR